jgi:hypothetical protein
MFIPAIGSIWEDLSGDERLVEVVTTDDTTNLPRLCYSHDGGDYDLTLPEWHREVPPNNLILPLIMEDANDIVLRILSMDVAIQKSTEYIDCIAMPLTDHCLAYTQYAMVEYDASLCDHNLYYHTLQQSLGLKYALANIHTLIEEYNKMLADSEE